MTKKVNNASFNNSWYSPKKSKLVIVLWIIISSLFFTNSYFIIMSAKRWWLRVFGAKIGDGVIIKPNVIIKYPWLLTVGNHVWIGEHVWIDNLVQVDIKDNVCISQGAMLLTGNHNYKKSTFDLMPGKIVLEDGVWIGAKSIVCPGITCKSHSILNVNSVANIDLDEYTIYSGNPAKPKKKRTIN